MPVHIKKVPKKQLSPHKKPAHDKFKASPKKVIKKLPTVTKVQPTGNITQQVSKEKEYSYEVPVGPPVLVEEPMCNVGVRMGGTKNLGNYESFKFDISLFKPCAKDEIEETYHEVKSWVDAKAEQVYLEAANQLEGESLDGD